MTWVAVAIGGSALLGYMGSQRQAGAATSAAQQQYQATQDAAAQQRAMFDIVNAQQAPYREAGYGALSQINTMLPQLNKMPTAADLRAMPGFEFGLNQGVGAAGQIMNVGGGGSNVDLARRKFAIDYATNVGLPQYMTQQTNIYNRLASLAGIGQTAQGQTSNLAQTTAGNIGQLGIGGASALGAGQIGAANAYAGGLQGIGNAATLAGLIRPSGTSNVSGSNFMNQYNAIGAA
tara:strand:- start:1074 stop:1775 length:702 start_codon:yes stop_codon:yes gene_type:complete